MSESRGATVVVTGGSRGIGRAIVEQLTAEGYRVLFTFKQSELAALALCESLKAQDRTVECLRCDLGVASDVDRLAAFVLGQRSVPYALICNAGVTVDALSALVDLDQAKDLFQVNFFSSVQLIKALSRPMARNRSGRIVLIGSILAQVGMRGTAVYAASKGALQSYLRAVIDEVARKGVTINCVRPGLIDTDMNAQRQKDDRALCGRIPARRFGSAAEVAAVVSFLLSPQATYVNGAAIDVDGGMTGVLGWT